MGGEWKRVQLAEVAKIASGKRPLVISKEPSSVCKIPIIGGKGPSGFTNEALYEQGILITGRVGTLGKLFAPSGPCWPSDNALVIHRRSSGIDETYLRYVVDIFAAA